VSSPDVDAAREAAEAILGLDIKGHVVHVLYIEPASDIVEEYYLSVLHDRVNKGDLIICSRQGGVDIEEVNRTDPGAVVKRQVVPSERVDGLPRSIALEVVTAADLPVEVREHAADLLVALFGAYLAEDATLAEINPLIRTPDDRVIALDAKVSLDGNAAFRRGEPRRVAHRGHRRGRSARDPGARAGHAVREARRRRRGDGQRGGPRDGDARRRRPERWACGELPRRRWWRVGGVDGGLAASSSCPTPL
jgi:succinyl-CoA synthetase beta subunit